MPSAFEELLKYLPRNAATVIKSYESAPTIVPIGSDCIVAQFLRDSGYRIEAFPFDWNLTLGALLPMFERRFADYTTVTTVHKSGRRSNRYNVVFMHDNVTDGGFRDKFQRRIDRFQAALRLTDQSTDDNGVVHIVRTSHKHVHHAELNDVHLDEIGDIQAVDRFLKAQPKPACYRIWLLLGCTRCYSAKTPLPAPTDTLTIVSCFRKPPLIPTTADNGMLNVAFLNHLQLLVTNEIK